MAHSWTFFNNFSSSTFTRLSRRCSRCRGKLGGSGRKIIRLSGDKVSAIGILYDVREENVAFLEFSRHFRQAWLPVPEIYAEDLSQGAYLEEDLGNTTLFEFLSKHRSGENTLPEVVEAYRKVIAVLPRFQIEAGRDLNYKVCYPRASFDRQSISWDLNYFKYYFLRLAGIPFNEQALEDDFSRLTKFLLSAEHDYFLYRDFQSRNMMLRDGQPYFLDYQGGRKGALQYDVASLLYDAKADLPPDLRQQLLDHYLDTLAGFVKVEREAFMQHYYAYVYIRIMQALGAYGFRGFYERKAHFLQSVPYALKNLRWLLHNVDAAHRTAHAAGRVSKHAGLGEVAGPGVRADRSGGADFQFFVSPRPAEGRKREWWRICFRRPQPAQSRPRRAFQSAHWQGRAGHRISRTSRKACISISPACMSLVDASVSELSDGADSRI